MKTISATAKSTKNFRLRLVYNSLLTLIISIVLLISMNPLRDKIIIAGGDNQSGTRRLTFVNVMAANSNNPLSVDGKKWSDSKTAAITTAPGGWWVARDAKVSPLGSRIFIKDTGWLNAEDTGSWLKGKVFDIFYRSRTGALQSGSKEFTVLKVTATAYSNDPISINVKKWRDGKTATMTTARWGVVATDPEVIPLGSRIFIKDMGWFSAEDTGSRIKGKRIDIFYPSRAEALEFGKKELIVLVEKDDHNS